MAVSRPNFYHGCVNSGCVPRIFFEWAWPSRSGVTRPQRYFKQILKVYHTFYATILTIFIMRAPFFDTIRVVYGIKM